MWSDRFGAKDQFVSVSIQQAERRRWTLTACHHQPNHQSEVVDAQRNAPILWVAFVGFTNPFGPIPLQLEQRFLRWICWIFSQLSVVVKTETKRARFPNLSLTDELSQPRQRDLLLSITYALEHIGSMFHHFTSISTARKVDFNPPTTVFFIHHYCVSTEYFDVGKGLKRPKTNGKSETA